MKLGYFLLLLLFLAAASYFVFLFVCIAKNMVWVCYLPIMHGHHTTDYIRHHAHPGILKIFGGYALLRRHATEPHIIPVIVLTHYCHAVQCTSMGLVVILEINPVISTPYRRKIAHLSRLYPGVTS